MNDDARLMVVACLEELSSRAFQERAWVRGDGPEVSSFAEVVCQLFDDTGLSALLVSGNTTFGPEADQELERLSELLDALPSGLEPATLLHHPLWSEVVAAAGRALALIRDLES